MKKSIIILIVSLFGTAGAFAGTTGQLTLTGHIPSKLSITITNDNVDLDLSLNESTGIQVGSVTELSNSHTGYTVTVSSANAVAAATANPFFQSATTSDTLTYGITYGGTAVTFTNGSATITDTTGKTAGNGDTKVLDVTYDGSTSTLYDGAYSDTLDFTIAAK